MATLLYEVPYNLMTVPLCELHAKAGRVVRRLSKTPTKRPCSDCIVYDELRALITPRKRAVRLQTREPETELASCAGN
jgi:hypothetical protein